MRLFRALAILLALGGVGGAFVSTAARGQADDEFGGLPAGPGQEETFYLCSACHSIRLVTQQRLTRPVWDDTLDWMVEKQGMPEPAPKERKLILDYLSTHFAPEQGKDAYESPFKR